MDRILGIDYGQRRIGVSISDPLKIIAQPLNIIDQKKNINVVNEIEKIIKDKNVSSLVVGLPLNMKGKYSEQTNKTQEFILKLKTRITIPIYTIDERLTSKEATKILIKKNIKTGHNKQAVDIMSAVIILQEYLDTQ